MDDSEKLIREVAANFPKAGINFNDITNPLEAPEGLRALSMPWRKSLDGRKGGCGNWASKRAGLFCAGVGFITSVRALCQVRKPANSRTECACESPTTWNMRQDNSRRSIATQSVMASA